MPRKASPSTWILCQRSPRSRKARPSASVQGATFLVASNGSTPLTYQCKVNGVNVGGATSSSYSVPVTTANNDGTTFAVVVSKRGG